MKKIFSLNIVCLIFGLNIFCASGAENSQANYFQLRSGLVSKFRGESSKEWGEFVTGVKTRLNTTRKVIALTFDACGGPRGSKFDTELINYLKTHKIPATLFINARWIQANPEIFKQLAREPLFEIENHGLLHKPCSVVGKSIFGIPGTESVGEVVDEIELNARKIEKLSGRRPVFFRSGTAYYDEISVKIAQALGFQVVNFNIVGDAGATFSQGKVLQTLLSATAGSIIILHMNQPQSETAAGVRLAIPKLQKNGFKFVKLTQFPLK